MPGEDDLSSRFDYLFEPLPHEESTGDAADTEPADAVSEDHPSSPSTTPVRLAFAAFILTVMAAATVVAALLLQRPDDATDSIDVSPDPAPLSTTAPGLPSQAAPPPPAPPTETSEGVETPTVQLAPQPERQEPTTARRKPAAAVPKTPKTRAPISVAPTKRAPFPSQRTGGNEETEGGGLLGGLPGPDLPGPL
ncbi:hypothetical protein CQY20_09855 [Mycolicibacterium agri]|uniref:Uncharacterized protein n=1 Tax=Mycolicibacterium agri TaxID=36811 RepID=A0A2A7N621_MYCAG|nr:hypothetical protein [Mycolicibacterium agri]PEG39495.1 hypothetical protein CQY20_09855 [Mycolicibacterium agri]GFG48678.1 hypothetical protein MAGR_01190 [Mycolicibacterium agri]